MYINICPRHHFQNTLQAKVCAQNLATQVACIKRVIILFSALINLKVGGLIFYNILPTYNNEPCLENELVSFFATMWNNFLFYIFFFKLELMHFIHCYFFFYCSANIFSTFLLANVIFRLNRFLTQFSKLKKCR